MTDQPHKTDETGAYEVAKLVMIGEALLVVEFGEQLSPVVLEAALAFDRFIQSEKIAGLRESAPTGNAVALVFDPLETPPKLFRQKIKELAERDNWFDLARQWLSACWRLPICYGGDFGPDLAPLAEQLSLSESEVIAAHLELVQRVFMVGFAPGFLYSGQLPELFNLPRLSDIKACVPAGSVSVALGQSVISSTAHPTGWRVIGRTPFRNFDPGREPAMVIKAGDEIRFQQIDKSAYEELRNKGRHGFGSWKRTRPVSFLDVLSIGPYVSVQDEGRPGYLRYGVSLGGAVDARAFEAGRLLVGNERGGAVLEMLSLGGRLRAGDEPLLMALTGARFSAHIEERPIKPLCSFWLRPGEVLDIGAARSGTYGYLSIAGGIDVPLVLGSGSTHIRDGFGGYKGRLLQAGDRLSVDATTDVGKVCCLSLQQSPVIGKVRILWSAQSALLKKGERQRFLDTSFEITHELDRMGVRLNSDSDPVRLNNGLNVLSGIVAMGDIQVPGTGQPIVLLNDHQPTGGYPRIATIIGADLIRFAQLSAGSKVKFKAIDELEAISAYQKMKEEVNNMASRVEPMTRGPLSTDQLLSQNLISGVVNPKP